jgi:murein L,D-transpeptidase YcbB/YkuD
VRFIPTVLAFGSICFGAAAFGTPAEVPVTKLTVSIQSPEPGSESGPAGPTANPETASRVSEGAENLSQKLQELLSSPLSNLIDLPAEKTAVKAFYQARGFKPFWTANGEPTAKAKDVSEFLRTVGTQGLDPADYPTPDFSLKLNAEESAVNEVRLTHSFLTYARHASSGRVSFTRVSGVILYPSHAPDPAQLLSQLDSTGNVRELLASQEPPHAGYKALKAQLAKELSGSRSETTGTAVSDSADVAPKKSK